jgi:uncharacterized caspase-like protein
MMVVSPRKKSIAALVVILALCLELFVLVSSGASEPPTATTISAVSGMSAPNIKPAGTTPAKKFAVVIGIVYDNYELGSISYADRDATYMYNLLTQKLGFPEENVILLTNQQATRENISRALDWLTTNPEVDSEADVALFYSGHGLRNGPGVGLNWPLLTPGYALVPFDFMSFDYKTGGGLFWDWDLANYLSRIHPRRMWITIDSCFSGGFLRPGITGPDRVVTTSSQADELSGEIPDPGEGVFTQFLIKEGVALGLPVEQAFASAAPRTTTPYEQNPQIADNYPGNLDFSRPASED